MLLFVFRLRLKTTFDSSSDSDSDDDKPPPKDPCIDISSDEDSEVHEVCRDWMCLLVLAIFGGHLVVCSLTSLVYCPHLCVPFVCSCI